MRIEGIKLIGVGIRDRNDLGTIDNPAISAQAIYDSGQTTSGWYYIQTSSMGSARQVYCNMDDESGGWMMIGYTPEFNNATTDGLMYPNYWENGEGTFDRMRVLASDLWYHNGSAQCDSVLKMASTTASLTPLLTNMTIANKVVYTNPNNLQIIETSPTTWTITNNTPMTGTWYDVKGHTLMTGPLTVNAPGDWIYTSNSWWTVCGPSTDLQATGRSSNAQGTGSWTNPSTNQVYGMANVANNANSARTDIKTYAVYVK